MLLDPLLRHAQERPDAVAMTDDRGSLTYVQLAGMSAGLSQVIGASTDRPRVGVLLPACTSFAACFYGALLAGKAIAPINFLLSPAQVAHQVIDSGIDVILSAPPLAEKFAGLPAKIIDLTTLPAPTSPLSLPTKAPAVDPNNEAILLYTSGTSGQPKGVPLTHANLATCVDACIHHVFRGSGHHFLGLVPLFHSTGFTGTVLAPIHIGAPVDYMARFSPVAVLQKIRDAKCDLVIAVPSMYGALLSLKNASAADFAHVFALLSGGEPASATLRENFEARFGKPLYQGYGLSETCGPIAVNAPHAARANSVGQLVPGGTSRVVDENGKVLPPGSTGEIQLGGPTIMHGYLGLPDATRAALTDDGYFRTGDLGHVDADGFLFITGRAKDMIIVGGEKLAPVELEDMLLKHPAIAEAAVVGRKDESRGEVAVAFVVTKEGQSVDLASVKAHLKPYDLPGWKTPREVFVVDSLPRSPTGKVLKRELAEKANAAQ